ncbi:hypothetical protein M407DRAFT_215424, partial [Tulasnella calospora MUT 4182]
SKPRSKSKSRRELFEHQDFDTELSFPSKLDSRLPVSVHEQNSFSEDSPSPRPSRSTASSRTPLKLSRRVMVETDNATPAELRGYSPRVPVPSMAERDTPRTPSLPPDLGASPPRDLQRLGHFRVVNADESSDDATRSVSSRFSPIPLQTPPVEFQRRLPSAVSQLQGGRSPASEFSQGSPLHSRHRAPCTPSALLKQEELPEFRAASIADPQRPDERRQRRKSHGTNDIRKAPPSVFSTPSAITPTSQPRTPRPSTRTFSGGTPAPESLTPRSSRSPQPQTFLPTSPSSTSTLLDTTPRREVLSSKELGPQADKKSHRSGKNPEVKHIDASPRERGHALRGLFDKLGLGFAFDQTPQEIGSMDNFQSEPDLGSTRSTTGTSEQPSWAVLAPPTDARLDRQTALFTALSSSSCGRSETEADEFCEPTRNSYDEDGERDFAQTYVVDDDDGNVFGLTAATSLNRISASPNPDTHSEPADQQIHGKHIGQSNSDDLYFSPDPTRPNARHPVFNRPVAQDYAEGDRQFSREPRDSNRKSPPRALRRENGKSEHEESWGNRYDGMLPAPSLPISSPSIVIQPSTSMSSNDALPRIPSMDSGKREVPIYAFVFTDLVLLTVPVSERNILRSPKSGEIKDCWRVVDDVGISRVLGVKNLSGKLGSPYAIPVYISLPERMTSRMALAPPNILEEARSKWFDAFDKCSKHTLRSLCFPPKPDIGNPGSVTFSPLPKSRGSVFATLALAAPLLRSPSQLAVNGERAGGEESTERLQRQWWSTQFQNVMREMERGDIPWMTSDVNSAMAVQPQQRRSADPKRTSIMGGPRPLILGSKLSSSSATEERKGGLLRSLSRKGR